MADSILRLKVESQEYDAKLKRAAEGLQKYTDGCRKAGVTLEFVEQETLEFVRALGNMETTSRSAKGSISEMTKAFTDLSVQYNKLTDAEKSSPFGQALKGSLDELKGRIQADNAEIKNISDSLNGGGGLSDAINAVTGKFGLSIDQITKFGGALGIASSALKVMKDAFFASETNVDEWGRTVTAAESVYGSFLQSLNNGDFSGFLSRLGEVIDKAKEAYNALDELGTRMTIINPERTRLQARATELKAIIRRQGAGSEAGVAAQNELKQVEGMLIQAFKTESKLNMNAFKAQVDKKLQEAGIKLGQKDYDFLMRTFSSDASFTAMRRGAKGSVRDEFTSTGARGEEPERVHIDDRNMNQRLLDLFTDEWRKEYSPLLNAAFSARSGAASTMLSDARYLKEGGSGGGGSVSGGGGSVASLPDIADFNKQLTTSLKDTGALKPEDILGPSEAYQAYTASIKQNIESVSDSTERLTDALGALNKAEGVEEGLQKLDKTATTSKQSFGMAASAAGALGSALAGIEDPGARAAGLVLQSLASIALGFASAAANPAVTGTGWGWLAFVGAGLAAVATTISTIHQLTGFAEGGIVGGNSYSGDNVYAGNAWVNSGELVLNKAQQGNLASQLSGNGLQNIAVSGRVKGTDIILSIDRSLQLQGKQLLTWGR